MEKQRLTVNETAFEVEADPSTPLLWVLRDHLGLTGTKFGCGVGQCRACTVHVDGEAIASCQLPLSSLGTAKITTIEGLAPGEATGVGRSLHVLQKAWIDHAVPQCGYCQSGQLMSAAALLSKQTRPTDDEIITAMRGNLCRCGTYGRILKTIRAVLDDGAPPRATPVPAAQNSIPPRVQEEE